MIFNPLLVPDKFDQQQIQRGLQIKCNKIALSSLPLFPTAYIMSFETHTVTCFSFLLQQNLPIVLYLTNLKLGISFEAVSHQSKIQLLNGF